MLVVCTTIYMFKLNLKFKKLNCSSVFPHLQCNVIYTSSDSFLNENRVSFHLGKYQGIGLLGRIMSICIKVGATAKLFS